MTALDFLLQPDSVAVVGASDDRSRIGGRTLGYLLDAPFAGEVHAVNPKHREVQGQRAVATLSDLEQPVDVAILAIPAAAVGDEIARAGACGVRGAIVFSAGYAETGAEGRAAQDALRDAAASAGVRLLGPNCLGAWNAARGYFATFTTSFQSALPRPGRIALVSQSGAVGTHVALLARERGLNIGHFVSTGNECDVTAAECIAWYAAHDDVDMILVYLEGARDGAKLAAALALARANGKPVLCLKVGRSRAGAEAAASHTAALAGRDLTFDGVLQQFGAWRAPDIESLLDVAYALKTGRLPRNQRVGLETMSGGVGILMTDEAVRLGLEVAPLPLNTQQRLGAILPYASVRNPVDITAQFINQPELVPAFLDALLDEGDYGAVVAFHTYTVAVEAIAQALCETIAPALQRHPDMVMVLCVTGDKAVRERFEACGCLVFEDPCRALRAVAVLRHFAKQLGRRGEPAVLRGGAALPAGVLNEHETKRWLRAASIPVGTETHAETAADAISAAAQLGYPLVAKLSGARLAHKTEVGGVVLGIASEAALRVALSTLEERVSIHGLADDVDGYLLCREAPAGLDMIVGAHADPAFGMTVMVGLGGTLADVLDDVAVRIAPINRVAANAMLDSLRGRALLDGVRGSGPYDVDALVSLLVSLSQLVASLPNSSDDANAMTLESLDLNPVRVLSKGEGVVTLDALLVRS